MDSQYSLGKMFENGDGVEQSFEAALFWYMLASDSGSGIAKYEVARFYECGLGVDESMTTAIRWFHESAESGNVDSQLKMGEMYELGNGVEQSLEEAAIWYRKAAENGNPTAQLNLGYLFEWGKGVEQSLEEAEEWFTRALKSGNGMAAVALQSVRKKIKKQSIQEEIVQSESDPIESDVDKTENCDKDVIISQELMDDANSGDPEAQFQLGKLFESRGGGDEDLLEAVSWYRRAYSNGNTDAEIRLRELGYLKEPEEISVNGDYGFDPDEIRDAKEKVDEIRKIMNLDELYAEDEEEIEEKPVLEKGWDNFIRTLSPIQRDYLRHCLYGSEWKEVDHDRTLLEDSINELSSDTIDDIVIESGVVVEYYVDGLKEVL